MSEAEFFFDIEQGSPEWHEIRRGIPTASEFSTILSNGKGHDTYLNDLAGEILSGQVVEGYTNSYMMRGKEMEPEARDSYARATLTDVRQCGFVRRKLSSGRYVGCSPDGLIESERRILEIKTMKPGLMVGLKKHGKREAPEEHMAQVQGALWICGWPRATLMIFYRGMPWSLSYDVERNEAYIDRLAKEVEAFDHKLHVLVKQVGR